MANVRVVPPAVGDFLLPGASLLVFTAFTTAPAWNDYLAPYLRAGKPKQLPHDEIGKFFSAQTRGAVSSADAAAWSRLIQSEKWYWKETPVFLTHNATTIIWGLLAPLQLSSALRERYPKLHIWSGRLLLLALVPATLSGFRLGMNSRVGRKRMMPLGFLLAGYVLYQAWKAYEAIVAKPRRAFEHRLRMTKLSILLLGIPLIRPVFVALTLPMAGKLPVPPRDAGEGVDRVTQSLGLSFLSTLMVTLAAAEGYGWMLERARAKALGR